MTHFRVFNMTRWLLPIVLLFMFITPAAGESLEEGFMNPPREYSMVPLWSWNGRLVPEELRWQIDQMVDKGVYGAFMHARAGINMDETPYFSDGWWKGIEACVRHGTKVGFDTWLYDEDKWPSGAAGGRTIERNPTRNRQKVLRREESRVRGPKEVKISIPDARYVVAGKLTADNQLVPDSLLNLTALNNSDSPWSCRKGDWIIFGYIPETHEGVNYLNKQTIRDFIDITHEEYAKRFGEYFGKSVPGVFFDEIQNEAGKNPECTVWAEGFAERFRQMKGYDLPPLLPALSTDIGPTTPKVRCDYYDVYTTIYEEAWFKQLADWCDTHQIELTGHTIESLERYVTQGNYMRTMRHLQIPTTDNEDFRYTWPRVIDPWKPKQIASVSHLYGHRRAGVEAMGGAGWAFTLDMGRYGFNMLSVYGTNFFISHLFHYAQDKPANVDDWPNSWFFRNPYWKYFKTFADHGSRLSYMLTGGEHVVDVAVLYPQTNCWAGYGPGSTEPTISQLVAAQIDVDLIDPESLIRAEMRDKSLVVGDMRYQVLIIPRIRCIRLEESRKLRQFIEAGGIVIVHDLWPTDTMENGKDDPKLIEFERYADSKGVRPVPSHKTIDMINENIERDIIATGDRVEQIRYQHVRRDGKEIYWIVNSGIDAGTWEISFRAVGTPSIWQPEDGSIAPLRAFVRRGQRAECRVSLDGWQGCFVVFDVSKPSQEGGAKITETNLLDAKPVQVNGNRAIISGLLPPEEPQAEVKVSLYSLDSQIEIDVVQEIEPSPKTIALNDPWQFLPTGNQIDYEWRTDLESTILDLPVMRAQWERETGEPVSGWHMAAYDDSRWRRVKVLDTLHAADGADRYRSRWEARFITFYYYTPFDLERFFQPTIGGEGLQCSKTFVLPPEATKARLAVICDSPFRVYINEQEEAAGKGGGEPECFVFQGLRAGESTLTIAAENSQAILAEGAFLTAYGAPIPIFTDATWRVSLDGEEWSQAWEYVAPPERPYGEPPHPWETALPNVIRYRVSLPPGVAAIHEPKIEGEWQAWADGVPLIFIDGERGVNSPPRLLAIRVTISEGEHGLIEPVRIRCAPAESPLGSWTEQNLDWYSGRAIYTTEFDLDDDYKQENIRLQLDLGKVCYCAEIWLNDELVGTRVWPPYRVDITDHAKPGPNKLDIVVANLIANRMRWDIFDDAKTNLIGRRWHDSSIRRDRWCLQSGLLGPVRIIPLRKVELIAE
ncbi:MAG: glycosyl hydrolase [bacterium]